MVLVAGFLTMHGFFAVSAGADTHITTAASAESSPFAPDGDHSAHSTGQMSASTLPMSDAAEDAPQAGSDGAPSESPHPAEHHGLLAGCVVALVGIAVLTLAQLLARRVTLVVGRPASVARVLSWVGDHAPALPPPRIALCVIRV